MTLITVDNNHFSSEAINVLSLFTMSFLQVHLYTPGKLGVESNFA
jgi:hypothetical protein